MSDQIYISGPMTGHDDHNYPAFLRAAVRLQALGWGVANPAENFGGRTDLPRVEYLRHDINLLAACTAIAMLPGWRSSRGSSLEFTIAQELGMTAYDAMTGQPLDNPPTAEINVHDSTREADPALRIAPPDDPTPQPIQAGDAARMWTALFGHHLRPGTSVQPQEVSQAIEDTTPRPILEEAAELTDGSRQHDYGHPSVDFAHTALMWTALFAHHLRPGDAGIQPREVPLAMIAVKLAREAHLHKRDNLVDIAGYARTAAMIAGDE